MLRVVMHGSEVSDVPCSVATTSCLRWDAAQASNTRLPPAASSSSVTFMLDLWVLLELVLLKLCSGINAGCLTYAFSAGRPRVSTVYCTVALFWLELTRVESV